MENHRDKRRVICRECNKELADVDPLNYCYVCGAQDPLGLLQSVPVENASGLESTDITDSVFFSPDEKLPKIETLMIGSSSTESEELSDAKLSDAAGNAHVSDESMRLPIKEEIAPPTETKERVTAQSPTITGNAHATTNKMSEHCKQVKLKQYWQDGLRNRLCLLVHFCDKEGVFKDDCIAMQQILQRDHDPQGDRSDNIHIVSSEVFDVAHLQYIIKRETAIFEDLLYAPRRAEHYSKVDDNNFLRYIYGVYLGIRLFKVFQKFQHSSSVKIFFGESDRLKKIRYLLDIIQVIYRRWTHWANHVTCKDCTPEDKAKLLQDLMDDRYFRSTRKENTQTGVQEIDVLSGLDIDLADFLKQQENQLTMIAEEYNFSKETVVSHAYQVFTNSVYVTGFMTPNLLKEMENKYFESFFKVLLKLFANYLDYQRPGFPNEVSLTDNESRSILSSMMSVLAGGLSASEQWLWIYYSGHNFPSSNFVPDLPSINLERFYFMSLDLFTNVVLCLDCCNPDGTRQFSDKHVVGLFACAKDMKTDYYGKPKLSDFTAELVDALNGEYSRTCPIETSTATSNGEKVTCKICPELEQNISTMGLVFPSDVEQYFTSHKRKCIPQISRDSGYYTPLVSAPKL